PLTEEGMSRMRKATRGLARLGVSLDVVLTSPLVRARQTAEIVAGGFNPRPALVNVESLAPDGTYAAVVVDLEKHARKTRIGLVGHEPAIGELGIAGEAQRHELTVGEIVDARLQVRRQELAQPEPHLQPNDAVLHGHGLNA